MVPAIRYSPTGRGTGRLVGTIAHVAARHGLTVNAIQKAVTRELVEADRAGREPRVRPVLDDDGKPLMGGRTPVYYLTEMDWIGSRPGKGANLRGRGNPTG